MTDTPAPADKLTLALTRDGSLRARICRVDGLVNELCRRHQASLLGKHMLARGLAATAVFPVEFKGDNAMQKVAVQWTGTGPSGTLFVELNADGQMRGMGKGLQADTAVSVDDNGRAGHLQFGDGYVSVLFQHAKGDPTRGQIEIPFIDVDSDLQQWLATSAQVATRLFTLVRVPDDGGPVQATGLMVQAMPDIDDSDHKSLLINPQDLAHLPPDAPDFALFTALFDGADYDVLDEHALSFGCPCSRERVEGSLMLVEDDQMLAMITEDNGAEIDCQFCAEKYMFTAEDLQKLLDEKQRQNPHNVH